MYYKHQDERDLYDADFADQLGAGESVSSATVTVFQLGAGGSFTDITSEFRAGENAPTINGSKVEFWLKKRTAGEQVSGAYAVVIVATLNTGRTPSAKDGQGYGPRLLVRTA